MVRRPTREWLEALVSGALLSSCAGAAPPVAPPAAEPAPVASSTPAPAPSSAPADAPSEAPTAVELPDFDPSSCTGPVPPRTEPECVAEKTAGAANPDGDVGPHQSPGDLANLRAACAIDAIVVYHVTPQHQQQGQKVENQVDETARSGEPCANAADQAVCESQLKNPVFSEHSGFGEDGERTYLVVSQAGELKLVSNREQLVGLIGGVDSKQDAAALLWLEGWGGSCAKLKKQGSGFVLPRLKLGKLCPASLRQRYGVEPIPLVPEGYEKDGNYRLHVDRNGKLNVSYLGGADKNNVGLACGRRPSDMALAVSGVVACDAATQVGVYLADSARLEAAAVFAFELMARELAAYGAPASIVERCLAAAADERRHTELMCTAARRYGVEAELPARHERALPSLAELARENTIEGCVRETWGALSAAFQARAAQDPQLAALYASIAPDELAHAALSWDIQDWLAERVDARALQTLADARAELLAEQTEPSVAVAELSGAPRRAVACELIRQLAA